MLGFVSFYHVILLEEVHYGIETVFCISCQMVEKL